MSDSISDLDHGCPRRLQAVSAAVMDSVDPVVDREVGGYLAAIGISRGIRCPLWFKMIRSKHCPVSTPHALIEWSRLWSRPTARTVPGCTWPQPRSACRMSLSAPRIATAVVGGARTRYVCICSSSSRRSPAASSRHRRRTEHRYRQSSCDTGRLTSQVSIIGGQRWGTRQDRLSGTTAESIAALNCSPRSTFDVPGVLGGQPRTGL